MGLRVLELGEGYDRYDMTVSACSPYIALIFPPKITATHTLLKAHTFPPRTFDSDKDSDEPTK